MDHLFLKSAPGCPKTGWVWLRAIDLHDEEGRRLGDYEVCEFCGKEQIRFVHYLRHPLWHEVIAVGRICAGDLSGDPSADSEERKLRNLAQRRANFLKLKGWQVSSKGNPWISYQDHHIVLIRRPNRKFRLQIDGEFGKLTFPDERSAKLRAFDVVMRKIMKGR